MTVAPLIMSALALLVSLLAAAALLEVYERLGVTGELDRSLSRQILIPIADAVGKRPSEFGLPPQLDSES